MFALCQEPHLLGAILSGGHSCAGTVVCDDGLVIALSLMKAIKMDASGRAVRAEGGVLWAELDRATQTSGLAAAGGTDFEVGIAGLTLGGGNGWLISLYGGDLRQSSRSRCCHHRWPVGSGE